VSCFTYQVVSTEQTCSEKVATWVRTVCRRHGEDLPLAAALHGSDWWWCGLELPTGHEMRFAGRLGQRPSDRSRRRCWDSVGNASENSTVR
jgi:hypothetical protein